MTVADLSSRMPASELAEWKVYLDGELPAESTRDDDHGLDGDAMYEKLRAIYPGF